MDRRGLSAFLSVHGANVRYLTGFTGSSGFLLVGPGAAGLITDFRYREQAAEEVPDDLQDELVELETSVGELAGRLDRQERQIGELRATVASLADILGASVEFQTFDDA